MSELFITPERGLSHVHIPTDEYKRPPIYDNGFLSDVKDEFALSWIGQLLQQDYINGQRIHKEEPIDPEYDALDPENNVGFEQYVNKFTNVKNKKQHDFLKQQIWNNNARRERLEASDRMWGPMLTSLLADPITYVPIPLAKGLGFATRFVKGGAIGAGLIGGTEPIRRSLDPTSTNEETAMIIGGSFLMSGLFSGVLGKRLGRTTGGDEAGPTTKNMIKKLQKEKEVEKYLKAHDEIEGNVQWEETGFKSVLGNNDAVTYRVKTIGHREMRNPKAPYIPRKRKETKEAYDQRVQEINEGGVNIKWMGRHKYARYDTKAEIMYYDDFALRKDFQNGKLHNRNVEQLGFQKNHFQTPDHFALLEMKAAEIREVILPSRKWSKDWLKNNPKGTPRAVDYDNEIYRMAYGELIKGTGGVDLGPYNILGKFNKSMTDFGRATLEVKDLVWTTIVNKGFASSSFRLVGNNAGSETGDSALTNSNIYRNVHLTRIEQIIDEAHLTDAGLDATQKRGDLGINTEVTSSKIASSMQFAKNKITGNTQDNIEINTRDAYERRIYQGTMDPDFAATQSPAFQKAVAELNKELKTKVGDKLERYKLLESYGAYEESIAQLDETIELYTAAAKRTQKNPEVAKIIKEELALQKAEKLALQKTVNARSMDLLPQGLPKGWVPLNANTSKIVKDPETFRQNWEDLYIESGNAVDAKKLAQRQLDRALDLGEYGEDAFTTGMIGGPNDPFRLGNTSFMRRQAVVDYKLIARSPVMAFYNTNYSAEYSRYLSAVYKSISMKEMYGDPFGKTIQAKEYLRLLEKEGQTKAGLGRVKRSLQGFNNLVERFYGHFNTLQPGHMSRQTTDLFRGLGSLTTMGGVVPSSITEIARPMMVHGFSKAFPMLKTYFLNHGPVYKKIMGDVIDELGEDQAAFYGSINRFVTDMGYHGQRGNLGRGYDATVNAVNKSQVPYYWANFLTPWTIWWKRFERSVGYNDYIIDSVRLSTGKHPVTGKVLDPKVREQITRKLAQQGISLKTAKTISEMPYEIVGKRIYPNVNAWNGKPGGAYARRKLKAAVYRGGETSIVTPDITDTPSLISGAMTFTSAEANAFFSNPVARKVFKPTKTKYGWKINTTYASLPFQFMPWAFAATNKMMINGGQALSDGQQNVLGAAVLMLWLGGLVTYIKNPYGFEKMTNEELVAESIERSGLLTIFGDLNFMLESISEGFTGNAIGVRPMFNMGQRFGKVESGAAFGEIVGPGPGIGVDLARVILGDYNYQTEHAMIRRMLPLQNLIFFQHLLRPMYDKGIEAVIG